MALKIQPNFDGVVGPVGDAEDLNGDTVPVVIPGTAIVDPTTGNALGTAANPVVVSTGGGGATDMAVHGPDATGSPPTKAPVLVAGLNSSGDVFPFHCLDGVSQSISEQVMDQPMGVYGTVVLGLDPSSDAVPFNMDANGNLLVVPLAARFWAETSTPLAASATFNGASRDGGAASPGPLAGAYFNAMIYADQTGTATLERSNDGAAWTPAATAPIVASTPLTLQVPVTARYHRIVVENGGTLQTVLSVNSSYTAS